MFRIPLSVDSLISETCLKVQIEYENLQRLQTGLENWQKLSKSIIMLIVKGLIAETCLKLQHVYENCQKLENVHENWQKLSRGVYEITWKLR